MRDKRPQDAVCDASLQRSLLQGLGFRREVIVMPVIRAVRTIFPLQQAGHILRIILQRHKRLLVHAVCHQTILAADAAAADRIELVGKGRASARIVVDFCLDRLRIDGFQTTPLYRKERLSPETGTEPDRAARKGFKRFVRRFDTDAKRLEISAIHDRRRKNLQVAKAVGNGITRRQIEGTNHVFSFWNAKLYNKMQILGKILRHPK